LRAQLLLVDTWAARGDTLCDVAKNTTTAADVDAYLATTPDDLRAALDRLREVIRATVPDGSENISYKVPTFNYRGRFLVSFAGRDRRGSFFVRNLEVMDAFRDELAGFDTSGGTIHFTADKPLPEGLVVRLVQARMAQGG
jgi:uncharacterized protein YdhG (YjbR/CyaY superfamily)